MELAYEFSLKWQKNYKSIKNIKMTETEFPIIIANSNSCYC